MRKLKFFKKCLLVVAIFMTTKFSANSQNVSVTGAVVSGSFPTLKDAFDAINGSSQTGNTIVIEITANTTESSTAALNAGTWASLTIKPSGGAARTISGAITAGNPIINLNGADNILIDGLNSGGNSLAISNTTSSSTTGTSTIRFINDASNNTITNCTLTSASLVAPNSEGGVISFHTGTTTGNDDNTISNCNISSVSPSVPIVKCIYLGGSSSTHPGTANSGNIITGNNIFNYFSGTSFSFGVELPNNGYVNTTISSNKFYQTQSRQFTSGTAQSHFAIRVTNTNTFGIQITGNTIGYAASDGTGVYTLTSSTAIAHNFVPIQLNVGTTAASSIQGNTIAGIYLFSNNGGFSGITGSAPFRGISVIGGLVNIGTVTGNTIGGTLAKDSISFSSSSSLAADLVGIFHNATNETSISNNFIAGIKGSNSNYVSIYGIRVNATSTNLGIITNNTVGGDITNSIITTTIADSTTVQGILVTNRPATITGNTVRNLTSSGGGNSNRIAQNASIIGISANASTTPNDLTISQNTIFNLSNTNTSDTTSVYGICLRSGNATTVSANRIYGLSTANTGTGNRASTLIGILSHAGTHSIINNQISISQSTPNTQPRINGIELVTTTANNVQYNSIYIGGTAANTNSSYGILRTTTGAANVQNNFVYNERSGSGTHFAIGNGSAGAFGTINNNVYITADVNTVGQAAGTSNNIYDWKTSTGAEGATNSYLNTIAPNSLFTDIAAGNLSIANNANQFRGLVAGRAAVVATTTDYSGSSRSGTAPAVGSVEYATIPGLFMGYDNSTYGLASNWNNGTVATGVTDVTIPSYAHNMPVLSADGASNNLTLNSGSTISIASNTFTINGSISGTGTISGSSSSNLILGGAAGTLNFTAAARILKDLTLNAGATATLGTDLSISAGATAGKVNVATGATFNTGGNLTLKSNALGTARIANSAGTINNNVTTEVYILGGRRAFRFLSHPFTVAQSMSSLIDDIFVTGDGTEAGTGGATAGSGFDATTTNAASSYWFDNGTNGWKAFTTASDANWLQHRGARVLVRGDRTQTNTLTGSNTTPNEVTLDISGEINTGNQNINLPNANNFHLVGNPYPSPVNIGTVVDATSNIGTLYWVWNSNAATRGAYVPLTVGSGLYNIPMNGAFFVQPTASTTLAFTESNKQSTASASLFRIAGASNQLELQLNYNGGYADKFFIRNENTATANKVGTEDGSKLMNPDVNIYSIATGNEPLTLDARPIDENTVITLGLNSTLQSNFEIVLRSNTMNNGLPIMLKDKYLNIEHLLTQNSPYSFAITNEAASQGNNRFELVFKSVSVLPTNFIGVGAQLKGVGIEVTFNTANETNMLSYDIEESVDGINYAKASNIIAKNDALNTYSWLDATISNGTNYYRIKANEQNGMVKYSQVVKVNVGSQSSNFTIYPNPVTNGVVGLQMNNVEKGTYSVKIFNSIGQELFSTNLKHDGGSATQTIQLGRSLAAGRYTMNISNGTTFITKTVVVE